jgi:hypothetical protein
MAEKIKCPHCGKMNEMQKFCIFCSRQMIDDSRFELMVENPEPYCLNCGRPVREDQLKCDCGYGFADITCPGCGVKNEYANKFCPDCGEKLWRHDVHDWGYYESFFKSQTFNQEVLPSLRNTSLYGRCKRNPGLDFPKDGERIVADVDRIRVDVSRMDWYLAEIGSRWKIVSPDYCINCLNVMRSEEYSCAKCGFFLGDKKRVKHLKETKGNYSVPEFDLIELKWTSKYSDNFRGSLAPSIGESQFEYRERLKWEFSEVIHHKRNLLAAIDAIIKSHKKANAQTNNTHSQRRKPAGGDSTRSQRRRPAESNTSRSQRPRQTRRKPVVDDGADIVKERFPYQFQDFSRNIRDICRDNGGDIGRFSDGILGCPKCSNYFHYLSSKFIETHRCPHCGAHFKITAPIYEYEWDASGISFDEYMDMYYGFFDD